MKNLNYKNYLNFIELSDIEFLQAQALHYANAFSECNHVADLGCGKGLFLDALKSMKIKPYGVEIDPELVEFNREKGYECFEGDLLGFFEKPNPGSFDGLFASHVIEHLKPDIFLELVVDAYQFLPEGGVFTLVFPNCRSIISQLYSFWIDPTHIRFYDKKFVEFALCEAGFKTQLYPVFKKETEVSLKKRIMRPLQKFAQRQLGISGVLSVWDEPPEECVVGIKHD